MRKRDKAGLSVAPLLLRVALGVTFLWAGLGKVMVKEDFTPEQAVILANAGVIQGATAPTPIDSAPNDGAPEPEGAWLGASSPTMIQVAFQAEGPTTADFPDGYTGMRLNGLIIAMYNASHPGYDETSGNRQSAYWPAALGEGKIVSVLAWLVALAEILGGLGLLVGLLTRLSAVSVGGVILGAMWLTELGPAMQAGGILPSYDVFDTKAWTPLLWQFLIACAAFGLVLLGAGPVSLDAIFFRPKTEGDDAAEGDDDEDED